MDQIILAAYKSLTVTALMAFTLGLTVLVKCYKENSFGSTFWFCIALTLGWFGEFLMRAWFTIWKERNISRESSAWMQDHGIVLLSCCLIIASGLLFIKTLTEDSQYGMVWILCTGVSFFAFWMSYV
jgi:H+/Cl- antiporter ClcA